jgi:hypothetical protein
MKTKHPKRKKKMEEEVTKSTPETPEVDEPVGQAASVTAINPPRLAEIAARIRQIAATLPHPAITDSQANCAELTTLAGELKQMAGEE